MEKANAVDPAHAAGELIEALTRLETALLSPMVAGEMESWARAVQEATATLSQLLPGYLKSIMHPQYAEIAKSDSELLTRVEQLIAEDQHVLLLQDAFRTHVNEFAKRVAHIKKDEAQVASDRARLEQEGIDLILRVRRQRAAADTWLTEANYRDRGPVD